MRLLERNAAGVIQPTRDFLDHEIPRYAILSHTWGAEEVLLQDLTGGTGEKKLGYEKIRFCGDEAWRDGLRFCWVDTCCIDKTNNAELQEAINSMFRWYRDAVKCYVYLADVSASTGDVADKSSWEPAFRKSRWFTRGWTLQELLAPASVEFFSKEGVPLGTRKSLEHDIHCITGLPLTVLQGSPLSNFSISERLSWVEKRETTRKEDKAYSLLGLFEIHMPLIYGEGETNAFRRLRNEIRGKTELPQGATRRSSMNCQRDSFAIGLHLERVHMIANFAPRDEYMSALKTSLLPDTSGGMKVFVLYGMGGIGKTQIAIQFAREHQHHFQSVFFLDGSSRESLMKSLEIMHIHITAFDSTAATRSAVGLTGGVDERIKQWLALEGNNEWLLIFDNVDKECLDEGGYDLVSFFPPRHQGSIIVTTRLVSLSRLGHSMKVGRLDNGDSDILLRDCIGTTSSTIKESPDQATARMSLLNALDGLPLAISQAGRFMKAVNIRPDTYLEMYQSSKREVMDALAGESHHLSVDPDKGSIRSTWMTSLSLLKEKAAKQGGSENDHYCAFRLLELFAYFEPTDISYDMLKLGLVGHSPPPWYRRTFASKIRFFSVIRILLNLSLIDNNMVEGSYSMHRVVHDWLSTYVCGTTDLELLRLAVAAIHFATPLVYTSAKIWTEEQQHLVLHAVHVLPRLRGVSPDNFFVSYEDSSEQRLQSIAALLGQDPAYPKRIKFDCTLLGITRLLRSCSKKADAADLLRGALEKCKAKLDDGLDNPLHLILTFHMSSDLYPRPAAGQSRQALAEAFLRLGAEAWAIRVKNMLALTLEGTSRHRQAIDLWLQLLHQSRALCGGNVFLYPALMIFTNLRGYVRGGEDDVKAILDAMEEDGDTCRDDLDDETYSRIFHGMSGFAKSRGQNRQQGGSSS